MGMSSRAALFPDKLVGTGKRGNHHQYSLDCDYNIGSGSGGGRGMCISIEQVWSRMLCRGSGAGGGSFRSVCLKGVQTTDITDGDGPGPFWQSPRRGSVTQDGGTSGTVLRSLWRRQGNAVTAQYSAFHRHGGGLEDEQDGGHGGAASSLDKSALICRRNT
eukprot:2549437-Ditylum_brightwellii.AAC.1